MLTRGDTLKVPVAQFTEIDILAQNTAIAFSAIFISDAERPRAGNKSPYKTLSTIHPLQSSQCYQSYRATTKDRGFSISVFKKN